MMGFEIGFYEYFELVFLFAIKANKKIVCVITESEIDGKSVKNECRGFFF